MTLSKKEAGKLFVGGLSWESSKESLQQYFSQFGEITDCVVIKNNETGRSRGFGFVTFENPNCVTAVLNSRPHQLDGRTIDPKRCTPHGKQKSKKKSNFPKIFLGGLPSVCTETILRELFSIYGKVMEVVIIYDQERKKSRGFGFLSFESEESVNKVCAQHYVAISNKKVECKRAEPRNTARSNNFSHNQQNTRNQGNWEGLLPRRINKITVLNGMIQNSYESWTNSLQNPYGGSSEKYGWNESMAGMFDYYGSLNSSTYGHQEYSNYGPIINYNGYNSFVPAVPSPVLLPTSEPKSRNLTTIHSSTPVNSCMTESRFAISVGSIYSQIDKFNNGSEEKVNGMASAFHPYRRQ